MGKGGADDDAPAEPEPEEPAYESEEEEEEEVELRAAETGREEAVADALRAVLLNVFATVREGAEGAAVGLAATNAMSDMMHEAVELAFVAREEESDVYSAGSWVPDPEPEPAPVDVWARGVLSTRTVGRSPAVVHGEEPPARATSSVNKFAPSGPRASANKAASAGAGRAPANKAASAAAGKPRGGQGAPSPALGAKGAPSSSSKKSLSPEEAEREQRLRVEVESRRAAADLLRQQLKKDEEELERLEKLQKDLRDKEYAYDHKGQVVVLNKLDPDKFPAQAVGTRATVTDPEVAAREAAVAAKEAKEAAKAGGAARKEPKARAAKPRPPEVTDYVPDTSDAAPTMMEHMTVAGGVTLREGGGVKQGPPVPVDRTRMTRREFLHMMSTRPVPAGTLGATAGAAGGEQEYQHAAERGAGLGGTAGPGVAGAAHAVDPSPEPELDAWAADGVPIPPPAPEAETRVDPNEVLISQPDWGINPPPTGYAPPTLLPKPTSAALELTVGRLSRYPRDRPFALPGGVPVRRSDVGLVSPVASPAGRNPAMSLPPVETTG